MINRNAFFWGCVAPMYSSSHLDNRPCSMSNETNDPKVPHREDRGPMLPDRMIEVSQPSHLCAGLLSARQYYEDLITKGDLIRKDELVDKVDSLIQTVGWNMADATIRACAKEWGLMDENGKWKPEHMDKNFPPHPPTNTVMRDGGSGTEKNFTKL